MQTLVTSPRVAHALDPHRAEDRLQVAFVHAALRALDTVGPLDRTGGLPRAALIEVPLQELAHQLLAPPVQLPFEVALAHLPGFARTEVGLGRSEGGLGRRIRRRVGWSGAGCDGSHRSTLPQPPLRMPDHRINQNHLGRLAGAAAVPIHPTTTAGGAQRDPVGGAVATPWWRPGSTSVSTSQGSKWRGQSTTNCPRPRTRTALARFLTATHGSTGAGRCPRWRPGAAPR